MPFLLANFVTKEQKQWLFHTVTSSQAAHIATLSRAGFGFRNGCDKNLICSELSTFYNLAREVCVHTCMWACVWERQGKIWLLHWKFWAQIGDLGLECISLIGSRSSDWAPLASMSWGGRQDGLKESWFLAFWLLFNTECSLSCPHSWTMSAIRW